MTSLEILSRLLKRAGQFPQFPSYNEWNRVAAAKVFYLRGVDGRVLAEFGIAVVSAGQVSQLCAGLDEKVRQFQDRPLGEIPYLWVDALSVCLRGDCRKRWKSSRRAAQRCAAPASP